MLDETSIAVQKIEAENRDWSIGDTIDVGVNAVSSPRQIVAIFEYAGGVSDSQSFYLAYDEVIALRNPPVDVIVAVDVADDADVETVLADVDSVLEPFPSATATTIDDLVALIRGALNGLVALVAGLLLMSVVVAIVGIVLTLYLAVFERTREIGLLRAIGMTRKNVRKMIRFESVLIALFGTVLGLALGLFCGWALSIGVVGEGVRLGVPWLWIGAGFVGAVIAGVLAAVVPAYRASRLDVITAIGYE
jgi:putative ABC transport system permease protein